MTELLTPLLKIATRDPNLVPDVEQIVHSLLRGKIASLEKSMTGKLFVTVNKTVAREVDFSLKELGLIPYYSYIRLRNGKLELHIMAETRDPNTDLTTEAVSYTAKEIAGFLRKLGYPTMTGEGVYNPKTDEAFLTFTQH